MGKKPKDKKHKKKKPAMADLADRHDLYQKSVQSPEPTLEFFVNQYTERFSTDPELMREDFCGTAYLSTAWCQAHSRRHALGVDLCDETLAWGRQHNIEPAGQEVAQRIKLMHANVLDVSEPKADITCALNFSYNVFKSREQLRQYFAGVYEGLQDKGLFVMDVFGGTESMEPLEEEREVDEQDFTYIWDQDSFNPIDHHLVCYIHFKFEDGSKMKKAFAYDWRLWSLPELTEVLVETGFDKVQVFWEEMEDDEDDDEYMEGSGDYYAAKVVENQESWVCYIVAEKCK